MKRLSLALALGFGLFATARARAAAFPMFPQTFVAIATVTPPASGVNAAMFQNTDAGVDVWVTRVDVVTVGTAPVGGLMEWMVFASTQVNPGSGGSQQAYLLPLTAGAQDGSSAVLSVSTSPTGVLLESAQPILPPLFVNDAPAATANLSSSWGQTVWPGASAIKLPKGSKRGLVFQKQKMGATDVTDGTVMFRVEYVTQ